MRISKIILLAVSIIFFCLFLYPTALNFNFGNTDDVEVLLSKSLSSKKMSLISLSLNRLVFNEIIIKQGGIEKKEVVNYNLLGVEFLSTKELLKVQNIKIYAVYIDFYKNKAKVNVQFYKSGINYEFEYEKIDSGWKLIECNLSLVKFEPSKAYYIYWEIVRMNNPNYMDFEKFGIPKDSLI